MNLIAASVRQARPCMVRATLLAVAVTISSAPAQSDLSRPKPLDLTHTTVVASPMATPQEQEAAALLIEEEQARTGTRWSMGRQPTDGTFIVVARTDQVPALLPPAFVPMWTAARPAVDFRGRAEGFAVRTLSAGGRTVLVVAGNDSRGVLYGAGCLLRSMQMSHDGAFLNTALSVTDSPAVPIRSHQIGYRFKNNTYDGWTLAMFEQQIRDLAVFGISGLQVISPISDDAASSPLFPAPALETVVGISRLLAKYGLDCELYYPEMRKDYADNATVAAELNDFEALVKAMPKVDALYIPGGDPGHTAPAPLLALVEKEAAIVRRYHPGATVWVSAQGFDQTDFAAFYRILREQHPTWLTGVFFGPQSRDSFETQRANIPRQYRMLFYPDIGHTMHAQFPVPQWDPVFALTEGREPIDPRPVDETHIYRHFAPLQTGFVTYSEGVNDDVNKFLWTRLGWSSSTSPDETLRQYSQYFLGPKVGRDNSRVFADAISGLEQDWRGPITLNPTIAKTHARLQELNAEASPEQRSNWRFESALYRVQYDSLLQCRRRAELAQEQAAVRVLDHAPQLGSNAALDEAIRALAPQPLCGTQREALEDLARRLFEHVKLQLSVTKYGASGVERGANLDHADIPLNDRIWLMKQFAAIRSLSDEPARQSAIHNLAHWDDPSAGALHDDLGEPQQEPHLVRGVGFANDPEFYKTAIDGVADHTTEDGWRLSQLSYAEALYETPLTLHYEHLDPSATYTLRVTYAGEEYTLPLTLTANGRTQLAVARLRRSNPETVDVSIPKAETRSGTLDLTWTRQPGIGGGGRGRQVAEVWLLRSR